ncbi:hypothetical protein NPIL_653671 [Nephila pilipes]|uniref:Uncharacterized protein n=1 Tax=Nephila pilipes TaxID=299642 RepID=A0A8X6T543_NEPPI|nr:hypothetical protein NPIL_653671 [Nephila pilipes]
MIKIPFFPAEIYSQTGPNENQTGRFYKGSQGSESDKRLFSGRKRNPGERTTFRSTLNECDDQQHRVNATDAVGKLSTVSTMDIGEIGN